MNNFRTLELPEVVDPPRICLQIEIPNDRWHIAAFLGGLDRMSIWSNWRLDPDHKAKPTSAIWRDIFIDVYKQILAGGNCPTPEGVFIEDDMPQFRQDGCLLQVQCADGDWVTVFDSSKCTNYGSQPGGDQPQPQPGGGTQQYCAKLNANDRLLIPTGVNTGDTVTIDSASGAGNDTELVIDNWYCPDGERYLLGKCVGETVMFPADPIPTVNHMHLIFGLSVGGVIQYASAPIGTALTIPSGVTDGQLWVQVNDDPISDNTGSYDVCVTVKNNQGKPFTHDFDFTKNDGGWTLTSLPWGTNGEYIDLTAWHSTCNGGTDKYQQVVIQRTNPNSAIVWTDAKITFNLIPGDNVGSLTCFFFAHLTDGSDVTLISKPSTNAGPISSWTGTQSNVAYFWMIWSAGEHPSGDCPVNGDVKIVDIQLSGQGTDPF